MIAAPDRARAPRLAILAMAAVWVLALATRLPQLDHSLWWDEAYSIVFYATRGPDAIFSADGFMVNNHVLFNLLTWPVTAVAGHREWALRLWGLLPALGSLAVLTWWAWRRLGRWTAVAIGLVVAAAPLHQALSAQARGYGLVFLGAAMMLVGAVEAHRQGRWRDLALLGAGGVVATWTILPTVVLFVAHAGILLLRRSLRWRVVAVVAAVAVADLAFYRDLVPLILRYSEGAGLREGVGTAWHAAVTVPVDWMLRPVVDDLLPGAPPVVLVVVAALALVVATVALVRDRRGPLLAHGLGVVALVLLAMFVLGANLTDRYVGFLLLHTLVATMAGLAAAARQVHERLAGRARTAAVAAVGVLAVVLATTSLVGAITDLARLPREDYRRGARVAEAADVDTILLNRTVGTVGFRFYLGPDRVETVPADRVGERTCQLPGRFVLIDYPVPGSDQHGDLSCVRDRATRVVQVPQRNERAPSYRVFVVGPR